MLTGIKSKGSFQVKNPEIREILGLVRPTPPTPLSIFFKTKFQNISKHENNTTDTKNHNISKINTNKKLMIEIIIHVFLLHLNTMSLRYMSWVYAHYK